MADLEAAATDICTSHDFGKTYLDCDNGLATNQQGPENDREWLTRGPGGVLYLTYHDFAGGFPIIERSTDGGHTFAPCGTIIDPTGPGGANYTPAGGTLVSKPVIGSDGTVYVEFTSPTPPRRQSARTSTTCTWRSPRAAAPAQLSSSTTSSTRTRAPSLANIFDTDAIDGGGELYILLGGQLKQGEVGTNLYLFTSTDGGQHWTHARVNPPDLQANVLPAIAGGKAKGQALLGWFGSTAKDPNDTKAVVELLRGVHLRRWPDVQQRSRRRRAGPLRRHLHAGRLLRAGPGPAVEPQPGGFLVGGSRPGERLRCARCPR